MLGAGGGALGFGCFGEDEEETPEPVVTPTTTTPTTPAEGTGTVTPGQPGEATPAQPAPAAPPQPTPSALVGPYELRWIEGARGRQPMPATLLQQMPDCVWGRWLWQFGPLGELTVHNELLCEDPNLGTGICRAEFQTRIRWSAGTFTVPAPIHARSQFVNLRPQGGSWPTSGGAHNTTTIRCNVNLSDVTATLTEIIPGNSPTRPQAVTLDIGNGERIRLAATELEVDHAQIMLQYSLRSGGNQPPAAPPPSAAAPAPAPGYPVQ